MSLSAEEAKVSKNLAGIRNRVLVFSGKGGEGKSTVPANLALAESVVRGILFVESSRDAAAEEIGRICSSLLRLIQEERWP